MIRVYQYGLLRPTQNADIVRDQFDKAHRYRNALTEIERRKRAALRELFGAPVAVVAAEAALRAADLECESAARALKNARAATRSRSETHAMRERQTEAKRMRKEASQRLREARLAEPRHECACDDCRGLGVPRLDAALSFVYATSTNEQHAARAASGLYWGTYLLVEQAAGASFDDTPLYDGAEPNDPRFERWTGEGRVGIQAQKPLGVAGLADSRLVRVAPLPAEGECCASCRAKATGRPEDPGMREHPRGPKRRGCKHTVLSLRVGSDDSGGPVWAEFPMTMHRPLPADARIRWVTAQLRKHGPRDEWTVCFTVETALLKPEPVLREGELPPPPRAGAVAVDLGWRLFAESGEVRVAWWRGTDGREDDYRLPERCLTGMDKANDLRSIRDRHFDLARAWLRELLAGLSDKPAWLVEETAHLWQWKAPRRLAALHKRWQDARFPGDEGAFAGLAAWQKKDLHLWHWEAGQRRSALRWRKDLYRQLASGLADRYTTLVLEQFDLRPIVRLPVAGEERPGDDNTTARANRVRAAVSELRLALVQAFVSRGGSVEKVPAKDTTKTCHACGSREVWDQAAEVEHRCSRCGELWDQDENAAPNLLALWSERSGHAPCTVTARTGNTAVAQEKTGSRFARKRERSAEKRAAREAAANAAK